MKRYPQYRQSGIEWLGEVPDAWPVKRLKFEAPLNPSRQSIAHLDREKQVSFLPMEAIGDDGSLRLGETRPILEVENGYTFFQDGDVTIAKITPCFENGKGAHMQGLANGAGFGTTELIVVRPGERCRADFLYYLTQASHFRKRGEGFMYGTGGQKRVPDDYVRDFPVAWPSPDEQADIADYLADQTREVDALIADKEGLLLLLSQYRRAIITEAVTKGINQNAATRESNIGWLGEFPSHWKLVPLKRMAVMRGGHTPSTDRPEFWDGQIPWISPKDMKRDELWDSEDHISETALKETNLGLLDPGSTLIVVRGMILAHTFPVGLNRVQATINQDMKALYPIRHVSQEYLPALLKGLAHIFLSLVDESAHGTKALRTEKFVNEPLPIPPADEQIEILEFIQAETAKVDELIEHTRVHIDALREYKSALISEAVTGQIDVRGYGGGRVAEASLSSTLKDPDLPMHGLHEV